MNRGCLSSSGPALKGEEAGKDESFSKDTCTQCSMDGLQPCHLWPVPLLMYGCADDSDMGRIEVQQKSIFQAIVPASGCQLALILPLLNIVTK